MTRRTTRFLTLSGVIAVGVLALGAGRPTRPPLPLAGDLPKPLAQMTSQELWTFGNGLQYDNGPVQQRICARAGCNGRVDAVREQVPGPANISANGTVVARLMNLGRQEGGQDEGAESIYGIERDGAARFYLIALKTQDGWSWTVRKALPGGTGAPEELRAGNWIACRHDPNNPTHPKGRSEFARCPGQGGAGALFPPTDPAWIECSDGCCTAGIF